MKILFLLVALAVLPPVASGVPPLSLGSGITALSATAAGGSFLPVFGAEGHRLAFVSHANNLVTNDSRAVYLDLFVQETNGSVRLISVAADGVGGGDGDSTMPVFSADGRFLAFASGAGNLISGDTNRLGDVFVVSLEEGPPILVSARQDGTGSGNGPSTAPAISTDGRYIAFESRATDLTTNIFSRSGVFLRDVAAGVTVLASWTDTGGLTAANSPQLSGDGQTAIFLADLPLRRAYAWRTARGGTADLTAGLTNELGASFDCPALALSDDGRFAVLKAGPANALRVYRYDLVGDIRQLISTNTTGSDALAISRDGRFIAFETPTEVYVWDAETQESSLESPHLNGGDGVSQTPVLTPDGRFLAFLSSAPDLVTNALSSGAFRLYVRDRMTGVTTLASIATDGQPVALSEFSLPAVSPDGRRVAFETLADSVAPEDLNRASDVLRRDLESGITEIVSLAAAGVPVATPVGLALGQPSLTADGRTVAFHSFDTALEPADINRYDDVFLRDLVTGTQRFFSMDPNSFKRPEISGDGTALLISSRLVSESSLPVARLSWLDLPSGAISLVDSNAQSGVGVSALSPSGNLVAYFGQSHGYLRLMRADGTPTEGEPSLAITGGLTEPVFSPDSRWLVANVVETNQPKLMAFDLGLDANHPNLNNPPRRWLNRQATGGPLPLNSAARSATFSRDSRWVAFATTSQEAWLVDLLDPDAPARRCATNVISPPSLSTGAQYATYRRNFNNVARQICLLNITSNVETVIATTQRRDYATVSELAAPLLTPEGRFTVFANCTRDLSQGGSTEQLDVFLYDALQKTTVLLSRTPAGLPGNRTSTQPVLSGDGWTLVFVSFASDLVPGDLNDRADLFVVHLNSGDFDQDGLDDDWEMAYFNTLARDGTGDFDGDGASDRDEFRAGTDPTNQGSVFRVLTLTAAGGGPVMIIWAAVPNRHYQVQFRDELDAGGWSALPGEPVVTGATASQVDAAPAPQGRRFYRVMLRE